MTDSAIHVAHVTAPAAFGGLERVIAGLLPELVARGMRVTCVAVLEPGMAEPDFLARLRQAGVDVVVLRLRAREYWREWKEVLRVLARINPHVVHTHGYRSDAIAGTAARRAGFPAVTTMHGFTRQGWRGRLYEWVQLQAVRRFDAVVAVSGPLGEELVRRGVLRSRLRLIPNGIAADASALMSREAAREALALPAGGRVVGWVGRLSEEKDPLLGIAAFTEAAAHDAVLAMVGDGPLLEPSREAARHLGVASRVRFLGVVPDAGRYFRAFDVLLLSSRTEGTPMAVLESAVARVPVVATSVGGIPDLVGAPSPLLAPSGDARALGSALATLLADDEERARAGEVLAGRVLRTGGDDWVDAYLALYLAMAARQRIDTRAAGRASPP